MLHSICTRRGRVDSSLLVVASWIASLILGLSFCYTLCCKCPNGSCKPILGIYILIAVQWYKKRSNARCFDAWNQTLKFQESRWTPKFTFRECESHPHTLLQVGLRHWHADVVTHIVACAEHKVLRICCAPHQIDIVVKALTENISGGSWVKFAYMFLVYLRT